MENRQSNLLLTQKITTHMTPHQLERQSSDTFGRNTKADLELLRRINDRAEDRSEEIFALAVITCSGLIFFGIVATIAYSLLS